MAKKVLEENNIEINNNVPEKKPEKNAKPLIKTTNDSSLGKEMNDFYRDLFKGQFQGDNDSDEYWACFNYKILDFGKGSTIDGSNPGYFISINSASNDNLLEFYPEGDKKSFIKEILLEQDLTSILSQMGGINFSALYRDTLKDNPVLTKNGDIPFAFFKNVFGLMLSSSNEQYFRIISRGFLYKYQELEGTDYDQCIGFLNDVPYLIDLNEEEFSAITNPIDYLYELKQKNKIEVKELSGIIKELSSISMDLVKTNYIGYFLQSCNENNAVYSDVISFMKKLSLIKGYNVKRLKLKEMLELKTESGCSFDDFYSLLKNVYDKSAEIKNYLGEE